MMKDKIITIIMYMLLVTVGFASMLHNILWFSLDDITNCFYGGILKYMFILIFLSTLIFPVLLRRKFKKKWNLPALMLALLLTVPVFNKGILKIAEDDLRIYSKEKWDKHKDLRIYMIDDLETNYIRKGSREEYVISLLGKPNTIRKGEKKTIEYYVNTGIDPVRFYITFENDAVVETGKYYT